MASLENYIDTLTELINIGIGRAAAILNDMVQTHVELSVPKLAILSEREFLDEHRADENQTFASVHLAFKSKMFNGRSILLFPPVSASNLVSLLAGAEESETDLNDLKISTLNEVGNIILNGVMGSLGNVFGDAVQYGLPAYSEKNLRGLIEDRNAPPSEIIILAETNFRVVERKIDGNIMLLLNAISIKSLSQILDNIEPK